MRAAKLSQPQKLQLGVEDEPVAGKGEVVIDVSACGVCGSDLHYWEMGVDMNGHPDLIPGHEFCGIVSDPGESVDLQPGDRVTCVPLNPCDKCPTCSKGLPQLCPTSAGRRIPGNSAPGAFAEKVVCRSDMVRKLPEGISEEEACLIEPAAVALHAVRKSGVRVGDKLLVTGGGPIGLLCAAWARIAGAELVGLCEVNPHRLEQAGNWPYIHQVLDGRDQKLRRKLKQVSDGGFDAVVETSATDPGISTAMSALKPLGWLVLAGINFSPQAVSTLVLTSKELVQKGSMAYNIEEFETAMAFMADNRLQTRELVNRSAGLEDLQTVFEELCSGEPRTIKAVVRP